MTVQVVSSVLDVLNLNSFVVGGQGSIDISRKFKIQRLVTKTDALNFQKHLFLVLVYRILIRKK